MSDQPYVPPPFRTPETPKVSVPPLSFPTIAVPASVRLPSAVTPGIMKKKSKLPVLIATVVAGLTVLGVGAWTYFTYIALSPDQVMGKMIEALGSVDTFTFDGEATIEPPEQNKSQENEPPPFDMSGPFSVTFSGAIDGSDETNTDGYVNIAFSAQAFSLNFEIRNIDENTYIKAGALPAFFAVFIPSDIMADKWIRFNVDEIFSGLGLDVLKKKIDEKTEEAREEAYQLTDEQKEELLAAFVDGEIVGITQKFKTEKMNETPSYHFAFAVDSDALKTFLIRANEIVPEDPIGQDEMDDVLEKFDGVDISGEIWIGKKDFLPRKLIVTPVPEDETKGAVIFEILFNAYNEPVSIEEPADAKPIAELFQEFVEAKRKDTDQDGSRDQEEERLGTDSNNPDTDGDGLLDGKEKRYDADPLNSDTDGDGYLDGAEVTNGYDPSGDGEIKPLSVEDIIIEHAPVY